MATVNPTRTGGGELMSSIAAVRQLLQQEYPAAAASNPRRNDHPSSLADELSSVQQSRYEDRMKFDEERKAHKEIVEELRLRLEEAKREVKQEKAVRQTLEETNEALEKYKEELSSQLDTMSSTRSITFRDQEDSTATEGRIKALEKEKEDLASKLSSSQKQVEDLGPSVEGWKAQCLASQRQVKELQIQLDSFKRQYQTSQDRQKDIQEGQDTQCESFQKRLEESAAARKKAEGELQAMLRHKTSAGVSAAPASGTSTDGRADEADAEWKRKYLEAESSKVKAQEKVHQLEVELEALKRGKSEEEIEQEQETKAKVATKINTLNTSFVKMKAQDDAIKKEVEEVQKGSLSKAKSEAVKVKKESLLMSVAKVGAVLESLEGQLKDKLVLAKAKMDDCSSEFKRVREELRLAKEAVTQVQGEILDCQQQLKELTKITEEETSSTTTNSTGEPSEIAKAAAAMKEPTRTYAGVSAGAISSDTPTKKTPAKKKATAAKGKAAQKKRASTDVDGTATKRNKTK